jgi:hemerythrin-like domain-containing protein
LYRGIALCYFFIIMTNTGYRKEKKERYSMRLILISCAFFITALVTHAQNNIETEEEIPPTEDLMREHGALNRVLLIYEALIKRVKQEKKLSLKALSSLRSAVGIIREFIENYHEKLEETYIFPLFEKAHKQVKLVRTLRKQHQSGRAITSRLEKLIAPERILSYRDTKAIARLLRKFITMYRPHEAREDTVLFPNVRSLISPEAFKKLGELFEKKEQELFGQNGFESIVTKIATIERELGIYNLEQFTPNLV